MWNHIKDSILLLFREHPVVKAKIPKLEQLVAKSAITPGYAADVLLQEFKNSFNVKRESD
jgi:LAO/AO transport system kinase